jgi:hypothetical protein
VREESRVAIDGMRGPDYKFWSGIGVALVSLAPNLPDWLRVILAVLGGVLIFVSATGSAIAAFFHGRQAHQVAPNGQLPPLSPAQVRLLELVSHYQRQFAANKLIVHREVGSLHFDDQPSRGDGINLLRDLYGSSGPIDAARFVALVESMPADYLRLLPEMRWDSPFVLSITEAGSNYLARRAAIAVVPTSSRRVLAGELHDFVAAGVEQRNRLLRKVESFDYTAERERLVDWSKRVVETLDSDLVTVSERSRFEILGQYTPKPMSREPVPEGQLHIQTMWTEKLERLRAIIDRIGS